MRRRLRSLMHRRLRSWLRTRRLKLGVFEERSATCFTYAALDQSLVGNTGIANAPVVQSCSTAGLTQAEVHEIQDLIVRAS